MWKRFDPSRPLPVIIAAVVAGILAGFVASVLLTFTAEPVIDQAIALEEAHRAAQPHGPGAPEEPEIVSRADQKGVGRFAAYSLGGGAYGVLFGITFLALRRRDGKTNPADAFRRALLAGAFMAGAFTVMPFIKYPPNPPAVGDPATLSERQWKYLALIFLSVVVFALAARLSSHLRDRGWTDDERLIAVALAIAVPLGVVVAALPPFHDPIEAPANMVWRFRIASLGGNLLLWSVLTTTFGAVAVRRERELSGTPSGVPAGGMALRRATSA
jgi:predicted cobalt transporter CbtA